MAIKKNYLIEKRNVLNEIRSNNMTLQELRFFSIYLSKINKNDVNTRVVKFKLEDFRKIMDLGKLNINNIRNATNNLLCKVVNIPDENGKGYRGFQLFKECHVYQDETDNEWYVEIDAHDRALPLLFEFKDRYFTYELWNALRLKSPNQVRMYEILKQYEKIGKREISVTALKELLGIDPKDYTYWQNFKVRVLDACQKALKESTDICYEYERGKTGQGGKWVTIIFHIKKNPDYIDQITLEEYIQTKDDPDPDTMKDVGEKWDDPDEDTSFDDTMYYVAHREVIDEYRVYADERMTDKGIVAFDNAAQHYYPYDGLAERAVMFNNLQAKAELLAKEPIKNLNSYILKVLENEWKNG